MKRFAVGIDLGTTHCAIAVTDLNDTSASALPVVPTPLPILQLASEQTTATDKLLPSVLLALTPEERQAMVSMSEMLSSDGNFAMGRYARTRGATAPERLIVSAKSWLGINRHGQPSVTLPWRAPEGITTITPVDATQELLIRLRTTLTQYLRDHYVENQPTPIANGEREILSQCQIVLTVPASFDEVARSLTHAAAEAAGLHNVTLLEEPQAALYDWLHQTGGEWREVLRPGDIVLVCDAGGGTTDFTLIAAHETAGALELVRLAVGNHILLGGDNMDLALAMTAKREIETSGDKLDRWQFLSLVQLMRTAKESLLAPHPHFGTIPITIPSRSASLFANLVEYQVSQQMVERIIIDGFFPLVAANDVPHEQPQTGLRDEGLPYASDPAISRHLAAFLTKSWERIAADPHLTAILNTPIPERDTTTTGHALIPTHVLFNGGVFHSQKLRSRIMTLLQEWSPAAIPPNELPSYSRDLAVASGAATCARLKARGEGVKIRSGTTSSFYIGIERAGLAVPGLEPEIYGLCVVPKGTEEGSEFALPGARFQLITNSQVEFHLYSSGDRAQDQVGDTVDDAPNTLEEVTVVKSSLSAPLADESDHYSIKRTSVTVELSAAITELGLLELRMNDLEAGRSWKLEFQVRD